MGRLVAPSSLCSFLLLSTCFSVIYTDEKPRKSARAYSSPSSSSNSLYGSSSGGNNGYNDNFDSAFDSMDLNNNGKGQKIRISLPNPPRPPRPPRPMKGPNMGNFEVDPNRMPNMPRPPAPPAGFGPMDIEFNFPSYEPSVDDSFFDSDTGFGNSGYGSGSGSSNNGYKSNSGSYSSNNNNNNNNGGGGGSSSGGSSYGMRTKYAGTYYTSNSSSYSSTQRPVTVSSTPYSTYTTTNAGGATVSSSTASSTSTPRSSTVSTSSATTSAFPGSLRLCTPSTDLSVTTGRCVVTSQLANLCRTPQAVASSTTCPAGERCCFTRSTTAAPPSTPVTASPPLPVVPDGTTCTPLSNPSVTNGRCVQIANLATQCPTQSARSNQCSASQFCCFVAPQAVNGNPGTGANRLTVEVSLPSQSDATVSVNSQGSCRPASNPSANGQCIVAQNMASLCKGHQASKSSDCATTEWCCILDQDAGTRLTVPAAEQVSSSSGTSSGGTSSGCRPQSNPSAKGQCISLQNLASACRGHQASKSTDCASQEWCCINDEATGGDRVVAAGVVADIQPLLTQLTATADGSCRPKSNPSATGQCILSENMASQCSGRQASRSDDCNAQSWCCIAASTAGGSSTSTPVSTSSSAASTTASSSTSSRATTSASNTAGKACRPSSNPSASGQCVVTSSLSVQCSGRSASKSSNCSSDQWCCIDPSSLPSSTTPISTVPAGTTCTPRSNLAARGKCVPTSRLSNDCKGQPAAKSDNCGSDQWCCFTPPAALKVATPTGSAVDVKITVNTDNGNANANNNNVVVSQSVPAQCTPKDNPNVKNGKCLTMRELSQQCVDQKASASTDCAFGRFCCYSDNEVGPPAQSAQTAVAEASSAPASVSVQINKESGPSIVISTASASSSSSSDNTNKESSSSVVISTSSGTSKTCSPNANQAIKNGACMTIRELRTSCVEQKASPSSDCDLGSWCCFSEDNAVVPPPPPQSNTQVKIEVAAAAPASLDTTAASNADTAQCVPNSKPDVSNGVCLPTKDLRTRCKNQRVSKSPQCKLGQWCCFNDNGTPVQMALNEFSRNINTL